MKKSRQEHDDDARRWSAIQNVREAERKLMEALERVGQAAALYRTNARMFLTMGDVNAARECLREARRLERLLG